MARYVDGYLLPVPKKHVRTYRRMASQAARIWLEHGALEYCECVGEDLPSKGFVSFRRRTGAKANETVVFSWVVYRSRAHRDAVNGRVMADPRIAAIAERMMNPKTRVFDMRRMSFGGFDVLVEAAARPRRGRASRARRS